MSKNIKELFDGSRQWLETNGVYQVERVEGRVGSPTEYVQFDIRHSRDRRFRPVVSYFVQGGQSYAWFLYRAERGGGIHMVGQYHKGKKDDAVAEAVRLVTNHFGEDSPIM